jgi:hypothetical protein
MWAQHHHHLPAFHLRELLDNRVFLQVRLDTLEQGQTQLLMRDLATTETQRDLRLIAILQEPDQIPQLDVVIAIVRTRTEFHFFNLNLLLLKLGFVLALALRIFELAVVHQTTYGRYCLRRDLDQVDVGFFRFCKCLVQTDDAERLAFDTN